MLTDRRVRKNIPIFIGLAVFLIFVTGYLYTTSYESPSEDLQKSRSDDEILEPDESSRILSKEPRFEPKIERLNAEVFYDEKLKQKQEEDRLSENENTDVIKSTSSFAKRSGKLPVKNRISRFRQGSVFDNDVKEHLKRSELEFDVNEPRARRESNKFETLTR